jgi:ATP-dependent RNA helicase RhlE
MTGRLSDPSFESLGLSPRTLQALKLARFERPTPIQAQALPHALQGKDVIGCAATGTGKTAAFVIPLAERLHGKQGTRGLVLAPTRELAVQIEEQMQLFGTPSRVRSAVIIGGLSMSAQQEALRRKPEVIIATPGRLVDHLQQGTVDLSQIEMLVLDEADRMLDMGFKPQLTRILARVPKKRQTLLFSATMAGEVAEFARHHLSAPTKVELNRSGTTAAKAEQAVYLIPQLDKPALLLHLLAQGDQTTLVFTRTKRRADKVARVVERAGHKVARIHADRSQAQRKHALEGFKSGRYRVLVATDIAARGIDVEEIGHVINFDLPHVPEDYVHRIGRTARAAASGEAMSFASPEELPLLKDIEKFTRSELPRRPIPTDSPVFQAEQQRALRARTDPGPPQHHPPPKPGHVPGRHARTHKKRPKQGGAPPKPSGSPQHTPTSGSWKPRRRR